LYDIYFKEEHMENWRENMDKALQIAGKCERTRQAYIRSVRMLGEFYDCLPDTLTEDQLRDYFVHRKTVDDWAPNTMKIAYCAIKFFFQHVIRRDWHILSILRAETEKRLPTILSQEEVWKIFGCVKKLHNAAFVTTVYTCGLRLHEALSLEVTDIDGERRLIHVHRGKGARDRYVPLPENTLKLLRKYWAEHRNPRLVFPARGQGDKRAPISDCPMSKSSVQGALRRAVKRARINKKHISVHTLRHCYGTHLLEAGVSLPVIQKYMGHRSVMSTMIYLHLTTKGWDDAYSIINSVMKGSDNE
jgi:integrase/recombinase XerD